jgi:DNA-directed RNA polymerase alpha subunit
MFGKLLRKVLEVQGWEVRHVSGRLVDDSELSFIVGTCVQIVKEEALREAAKTIHKDNRGNFDE